MDLLCLMLQHAYRAGWHIPEQREGCGMDRLGQMLQHAHRKALGRATPYHTVQIIEVHEV